MRKTQLIIALSAIGFATSALATNGYFSHGYGMKSKGMGGAATAVASDTFGGANNPASMVWVGNRVDLGVDLFSPRRSMERFDIPSTTSLPPELEPFRYTGAAADVDSKKNFFLMPEFGYNRMLNANTSIGVTVYGNGGMNTTYEDRITCTFPNPAPPPSFVSFPGNVMCGQGDAGIDLMQLIIAPTLAYKINEQHSVGISPLVGIQAFEASGLQSFGQQGFSSNPGALTNNGHDIAYGLGVRIGWMGKLSETVTVGAAYASKIYMSEFDDYAGLFAEQGDFDVPSNWNLGIAIQASPKVKVALDYQRINYTDVASVSNPSTNLRLPAGAGLLGRDQGAGFGWSDVDVWKLGLEYAYSDKLTLRAGYNHGDNPINASDVGFNILAPGVIEDHVTLGFTYVTASGGELTMAYMHAFENKVCGPCSGVTSAFGGGERVKMYQDSIGIAYGWKM